MTDPNQTKRHDEGQTYVEKEIMKEPKWSDEDKMLAEICVDPMPLPPQAILECEQIILETVVAPKNERIERLEELLAKTMCLYSKGSQLMHLFNLIDLLNHPKDWNDRADLKEARELVKGLK